MDEESDFLRNKCGRGADGGGVDRISQLPDEILFVILSFLRLREAACTTVLSSRWLDLWKHMPNLKFDLKFDRISQLPKQIIVVILSFLPLREAAATSVLSSRWSDLWKHTSYLNFDMHILRDYDSDDEGYGDEWDAPYKCKEIVNSVIQSHKALSLKKFRLAVPVDNVAKCTVTKWLDFVFSRQVESLELMLTDEFVLEELLRESRICLQPQTDLIFFQSLKILCLGHLKVNGEDIKLFLRDCPLLEQLTLKWVTMTSDVEVCGEKLMLKHLDIHNCWRQKSIKVSAPNLTYMNFSEFNRRGEWKLLFENVPKLVEADFGISTSGFASSASGCFSQLQILKLTLRNPEVLLQLHVILSNVFTEMPNLKKLVIQCRHAYNKSLLPVAALILAAYPHLEEFKLWVFEFPGGHPAYMRVTTDVGRSHQHLKVFELIMARQNGIGDISELVTYVSNNCIALRKIIVSRQRTCADPANGDLGNSADRVDLTQRLQGKVPNHIQFELFNK